MTSTAEFRYEDIVAMERAAARAWPAKTTERIAGWDVRLSGGGTRRANSVLPIGYDGTGIDAAVTTIEAHYRAQHTRSYFQVSSASTPPDLDVLLSMRGYTYEEPCLLMAKRLTPQPMPQAIEVTSEPTADWLSVYTEPLDAVRRAAAPLVLVDVPAPRAFLLVRRDGVPVASALAVVSPDGFALVECVATRAAIRRSGAASIVMDALEAWSAAAGARIAVLQVIEHNTAAVTLYQGRSYAVAGRYHYRWKDVAA